MIKIECLPEAHANLEEIVDYLEINSSVNITSFLDNLENTINQLKTFPELGKKVPRKSRREIPSSHAKNDCGRYNSL